MKVAVMTCLLAKGNVNIDTGHAAKIGEMSSFIQPQDWDVANLHDVRSVINQLSDALLKPIMKNLILRNLCLLLMATGLFYGCEKESNQPVQSPYEAVTKEKSEEQAEAMTQEQRKQKIENRSEERGEGNERRIM